MRDALRSDVESMIASDFSWLRWVSGGKLKVVAKWCRPDA